MHEFQVAESIPSSLPEPMSLEEFSRAVARRARIVFAVALGFYLYALFLAATLLGLSFLGFNLADFIPALGESRGLIMCAMLPVVIFCMGSMLLIVWSLIPRPKRFRVPGPKLDLNAHPQLLEVVSGVAQSTGQKMPAETYIVMDVNAGVTERGGILGARKRRVLILGAPLFSLLTIDQFRAILAHEFGHFYWGDTRLGPWVRRAEEAIHTTIDTLDQAQYTAWINISLFGYAEWFFDITHELMRKQEFLADQLAARVAGSKTVIDQLRLIHIGDDAFDAYWAGTVVPILKFGIRPPVFEGFRRFLAVQAMSRSVLRKSDVRMKEDKTEEYHTHPALPERVAALEREPLEVQEVHNEVPAFALLTGLEHLEVSLLTEILGKDNVRKLKYETWEDVLSKVYLPMWQETVRSYAAGLQGVTPEALPDMVKNLSMFGMQMLKKSNRSGEFDSLSERMGTVIGSALSVALHKMGWELRASPGEPVSASRGETILEPFDVLGKLVSRKLSAEEWRRQCEEAGLTGLDLGTLKV
jgi:heat shock protein HtpX